MESTLLDLAARCEAADPKRIDWELDNEIALACGWEKGGYTRGLAFIVQWKRPGGAWSIRSPDCFTRSLDAAMTLLDGKPTALEWGVRKRSDGSFAADFITYGKHLHQASAATAALALTAACLRARAAS